MTVFFSYGIGFIAAGIFFTLFRLLKLLKSNIANGIVIGFSESSLGKNTAYYLEVSFLDAAEQQRFYRSALGSHKKTHSIGDSVSIRYLRSNPEECGIADFKHVLQVPILFVYTGVGIILFPIIWDLFSSLIDGAMVNGR
jgi:hypothetical protein